MRILNLAFYRFVDLQSAYDLLHLRREFQSRTRELGLRGKIILSPEGINAMMAGETAQVREFQAFLDRYPELRGMVAKESFSQELPYRRMLVKLKKEIISMGVPEVRPAERTGKRLEPRELKTWLDEGREFLLVDTRNDYEIQAGTFKSALDLGLKHFREFPSKLAGQLESQEGRSSGSAWKEKPVVMFCTGGIRCEKATSLALDLGIRDVYQLEGGILRYFEECGNAHYQGECFVFDRRVGIDGELRETPSIQCFECLAVIPLAGPEAGADFVPGDPCPQCRKPTESKHHAQSA